MPASDPAAPSGKTLRPPCWHLVCQVIDNFGDVGVLWRLARQLRDEHGVPVRFFIDDADALAMLAPEALAPEATADASTCPTRRAPPPASIEIRPLTQDAPIGDGADVVVLGFQVRLPPASRRAWLQTPTTRRPRLIQLDYLSAEDWVADVHGQTSLAPDGLQERFFYPGFGPRTGGLLLEHDLFARRDHFLADPANRLRWLSAHGVQTRPDELLLSLLCYPQAPLTALLSTWLAQAGTHGKPHLHLLAPGTNTQRHLDELDAWIRQASAPTCRIRLTRLPFLPQTEFDHLLWSGDLNLVRGEDSWIRALWAGKPWLWQAYPQAEAAHLDKLDAFLTRASAMIAAPRPGPHDPGALLRWQQAMRAWNGVPSTPMTDIVSWMNDLAMAGQLAQQLCQHTAADSSDLAGRLIRFAKD
ncbi:MAG: elongation factor P maturation arginine rhamnosyltransferase EarP [Lautropia sp.]|nr:elongation factor P maturation arginine rhamnosyltransferase EarP [Lautropia sp.]